MSLDRRDRRRSRRAEPGLRLESLEPRLALAGMQLVAVGAEEGRTSSPVIQLVNASTGQVVARTLAFEPGFRGGVRMAMGDLTGDGRPEVLAASGEGRTGEIRVFEVRHAGTVTSLVELPAYRTIPFGKAYRGGVAIASGDLDGNGRADMVAAMSRGRGTVHGFLSVVPKAPANDPIGNKPFITITPGAVGFDGGASVAVGDFGSFSGGRLVTLAMPDGTVRPGVPDGKVEIVVGSGVDAPPKVQVFDVSVPASPRVVTTISPFTPNVRWGLTVATGRLSADAIDDLIVSAGRNGSMRTVLYDGTPGSPTLYGGFVPPGATARPNAAVYAAPVDVDGDGRIDNIVTSQGDPGGATGLFNFPLFNGSAATVKLPTLAAPLRIAAARPGFETLASGLRQLDTVRGTGKSPVMGQSVLVRYTGFFDDGKVFDDGTQIFKLGQQVPGFVEGLATMKEGGTRLLRLPANLAYGAAGKRKLDADGKPVVGPEASPRTSSRRTRR